jgi:hypothetical protein
MPIMHPVSPSAQHSLSRRDIKREQKNKDPHTPLPFLKNKTMTSMLSTSKRTGFLPASSSWAATRAAPAAKQQSKERDM